MPIRYKAEHFEFPKRMELTVLKELPADFEADGFSFGPKQAHTKWRERTDYSKPVKIEYMTFCHRCGGWVPGQPHEHRVNNLDGSRLCGRKGTEFYCPRCAQEICFSGMMS